MFSQLKSVFLAAVLLIAAYPALASAQSQSDLMRTYGTALRIQALGYKTTGIIKVKVRPSEPANLTLLVGTRPAARGYRLTGGVKSYVKNIVGSIPLNTTPTTQELYAAVYPTLLSMGFQSGQRVYLQVVGSIASTGQGIYSKGLATTIP
jgi:hypothetical protein